MEFIEELKHAWGIKRGDTENIKPRILENFKDKNYEKVVELSSKLDYKKEPLDSELGYALCYSIWYEPGNDSEAMGIAQKCVEYYDEARFKEICSRVQERWADSSLKNAADLKLMYDFKKEIEENVVKVYESALTWRHENDALKKRISEKVLKAYDAIGEKYYDNSLAYNDDWKDRKSKKVYAFGAIPYFEKAGNTSRVSTMQRIVKELEEKIKEDNIKFGKPLKDFPEASGFCNKLIKAGYTTLGDFLKASITDIDNIEGMGPKKMTSVKAFRDKF
jgi:hypothetical protein